MRKTKNFLLTLVFIFNTILFLAYGILDLLDINILSKLDFTLLLIYEIISFILFTEVLYEKENHPKGD